MNKKKQNGFHATSAYALLQVVCWGFFAINMGFSSNVLIQGHGFTDSQVSILLGLCTAGSFVLQLVTAERIAASKKLRMWAVLSVLGVVMAVSNLLVLIPGISALAAGICYGLAVLILLMMPSFVNAIGMDAIMRGSATNYSAARAVGSLGYSVLAYVTGLLVRGWGIRMVSVMGALCAVLLTVSALWFHAVGEKGLPEAEARVRQEKEPGFLRAYPRFTVFLIASVFLQFSHNLLTAFLFQIMQIKQGGAAEQGVAAAISALVELPVMFFFPLMMRRLRCDKWVRFSSLFVAVKCVGILLAATPGGIYLAQATQMLGYGLYTISSVNYAELVVGRGESVRAQTYLGATATVGTLFATSTGGFLCQHLGPQVMVMVSLAAALLGGVMIAFTAEKTRQ